ECPAHATAPGRGGRAALWPWWCPRRDRGESPAQAATDRPAPCSPPGAQPDVERPAPLRIRVALSQSSPDSKARHRPAALDAAGVPSGVGAAQVPAAVLIEALPEKAWPERPG